jgi:hypothetical protein
MMAKKNTTALSNGFTNKHVTRGAVKNASSGTYVLEERIASIIRVRRIGQ